MSSQSYQTLKVQWIKQQTICKVQISRPKVLNAMNPKFFQQIQKLFTLLNSIQNLRVVILVAQGKIFTSGLDLRQSANMFSADLSDSDPGRQSIKFYQGIRKLQQKLLAIFNCRVPVLVGIHGKCVGGGVDLISTCDIRYCTEDAEFTIKQIDIGMAADLGTLQFFPNIIGNESTFRQMVYTGRFIKAQQAKQIGLVTKIVPSKQHLDKQLLQLAEIIASKSPIGIHALKQVIKKQFYKKVQDGLQYVARMNSSMLLTKDTVQAITAFLQKRKPAFPKL